MAKNGTKSKFTTSTNDAAKAADNFSKSANKAAKSADKFDKSLSNVNINSFKNNIKSAISALNKLIQPSVDYIEDLNVLKVAFGDTGDAALEFTKNVASVTGFDQATLVRGLATFRNLASTLNLDAKYADLLATNLEKMSLDISSLYNLDLEKASYALQGALTGQPRSIKSATGADVTQKTLQQDLASLGINKTVRSLNQAEKAILTYISLTRQMGNANGDMARTLEQPAQLLRVFKEQVSLAARSIGSLFIPVIQKVIPILTGLLMVFNEVVGVLMAFLKVDTESFWKSMKKGTSIASTGFGNVSDSASAAGKSIEETAKKMSGLRGFDKLNVITTPDKSATSGGAGGSGGIGGIDPKLLGALDEYNLKLQDIQTRATKVRDAIMEWLGFTKNANGEFEHTRWTWGDILAISLGFLVSLKTILAVWGKIKKLGTFGEIFGLSGISSFLGAKILKPIKDIIFYIQAWAGGAASFSEVISLIGESLGALGIVLAGIIVTVGGIFRLFQGIADILNKDMFNGVLEAIEGIALAVAGIALLFAAWPVAAVAAAVAIVALVIQYWDEIKKFFSNVGDWYYKTFVKPIIDMWSPIVNWFNVNIVQPIIKFFKPFIDAAKEIRDTIVGHIKEIFGGIIDAIASILSKIYEIISKIVEIFVALGKAFYTYCLKPIIGWIGKGAKWVYDNFISPVLSKLSAIATFVYDKVISPIWEKIKWLRDKAAEIFKKVGVTISDFISGLIKKTINGVLEKIETTINKFITMLNKAIKVINKIPGVDISKVELLSIPRLASGGFVDTGQMFVAREAGPEMVGKIGNQTAVANNDQIVSAISAGVKQAILSSGGLSKPVVIEAKGDANGLMNFISFKTKEQDMQFGN